MPLRPSSPNYAVFSLDDIVEPETNVRRTYHGIGELADSINKHGLLENLVVSEIYGSKVVRLHAGFRRFRALKLLQEQGRPYDPDDFGKGQVLCLVRTDGSSFLWDNLIENLKRSEIPPWHLGYRFSELRSQGLTQEEIAARCHINQGRVSRCCSMAAGLHPAVVRRLDTINYKVLTDADLVRLSKLCTDRLEPDEKAQTNYLDRLIKRGPQKRRRGARAGKKGNRSHKDIVYGRFQSLKTKGQFRMPAATQPIVERIVEYLDGTRNRLTFD